jgi:hypothetical protein
VQIAPSLYIVADGGMMEKVRLDRVTAEKVERGLYIQRTISTVEAAKFFQTVGVPVNVAIRVLTTPHRRDMKGYPQEAPQQARRVVPQGLPRVPPQEIKPNMPQAASWRDIVRSSGPTFGFPISVRPNN